MWWVGVKLILGLLHRLRLEWVWICNKLFLLFSLQSEEQEVFSLQLVYLTK